MTFRFAEDELTGKEQVIIEREAGDTSRTLENFAATFKGTRQMIHNTGADGRVTLEEIVVTLD